MLTSFGINVKFRQHKKDPTDTMAGTGSVTGGEETPTIQELAKALEKLKISQTEVSSKVKKIEDNDKGVKESQRKLVKLPLPPKFKGTPADLEPWIL